MDGDWTECREGGLCDHCFRKVCMGEQVLICPDEPGPNPRSWEAYCSTECRDARQTILGIAAQMEATAQGLRNS